MLKEREGGREEEKKGALKLLWAFCEAGIDTRSREGHQSKKGQEEREGPRFSVSTPLLPLYPHR